MMKMIKKLIFILAAFNLLLIPMSQQLLAAAQTPTQTIVCNQLDQSSGTSLKCDPNSDSLVNGIVGKIINILIFVAGAAAAIIIVVAGLMYVLSGGNPQNTARAKDAIIYAVIGLVIAIVARLIVTFVLTRIG